ncbi:hypothetical protein HZA86_04930 [Candidatus Uhrbacteria bacterium]|nr:hypothetical protein [Candidatus Uhrbacteria bacterium]
MTLIEQISVAKGLTLILKKDNQGRIVHWEFVDDEFKEPRVYTLGKLRELASTVRKFDVIEDALGAQVDATSANATDAGNPRPDLEQHAQAVAGVGKP